MAQFNPTSSQIIPKDINTSTDMLKADVFNYVDQETMKLKQNFLSLIPNDIVPNQSEEIFQIISAQLNEVVNHKIRNFKTALDGCMQTMMQPVQDQLSNLQNQIHVASNSNIVQPPMVQSQGINAELDKANVLAGQLSDLISQLDVARQQVIEQ